MNVEQYMKDTIEMDILYYLYYHLIFKYEFYYHPLAVQQGEVVDILFNKTHSQSADLRLWDSEVSVWPVSSVFIDLTWLVHDRPIIVPFSHQKTLAQYFW